MKLGHFVAIVLACLTLVFGALAYWDLQDTTFSSRSVFAPIVTGVEAIAFLLFPGGKTTFQQAALSKETDRIGPWLDETPLLHKRIWLGGFALSIYLSLWEKDFLQGNDFFTFGNQISLLLAFVVIVFAIKRYFRK